MNKLIFIHNDIKLVCNNHEDLRDYLSNNFDWYCFDIGTSSVTIIEEHGFEKDYVELHWVKQI